MRTTLNLDDDVLAAAKARAHREGRSVGDVVSELLRVAMTQPASDRAAAVGEPPLHYGFKPFASRGQVITDEMIERLRDQEGI